jgi:MoaA/NifB/PqqE/SkfB family radical SAM enzyme
MIGERIAGRLAALGIARCLTGRPEDLKKLQKLEKLSSRNLQLTNFLNRVSRDLEEGSGLANLLLHIGRNANPCHRRRLIENLGINWIARGGRVRTQLRTLDYWVPFFIVVSPTMRCNLHCTGCYSALYSKDGELTEAEMDNIFSQCRKIGANLVVLSGGEPYLLKDSLLRLFRKYKDIFFLTFTNATLLDAPLIKELSRIGNVAPAISVEGYQEHTDRRRSKGVYEKIENAMTLLKERGVIFGISVTYTRENVELVTDERFVEYYSQRGAVFAWYFMFMPVGTDPILDLVPTPEQRIACGNKVAELRKRYPVFMADFWNDGPAVGGCLAGGRRYLHILNSGRVEPCVYAHFGVDNIKEKSLLEAANSPFFRAIRREFPFNESGNLRRPCMIIDNPEVLRKLVAEHIVPQGHEHAEDIIRNPKVVHWIDRYAQRMKVLTEGEWQRKIEDPSSRWHKEKEEYKLLFRFKKSSPN